MLMAALHPPGGVGLVGSGELPQPDSIAANRTHTGIRIKLATLFFDDPKHADEAARLIREFLPQT